MRFLRATIVFHTLMVARVKRWGDVTIRELGMDMYTLLYLKWIPTKTYCMAQGTLLRVMLQPG